MFNPNFKYCLSAALVVCTMQIVQAQVSENSGVGDFDFNNGFGIRNIVLTDIIDSKYLKDSTQTFVKNGELQDLTWELIESVSFVHDHLGKEQYSISKMVDNGIWENQRRSDNFYGNSHLVMEQSESVWIDEEWQSQLKRQFTYNYLDEASEILVLEKIENSWVRSTKRTYEYGQYDLVSEETLFVWDDQINEWIAETRILFTYNQTSDVNQEVVQVWSDSLGVWVNQYSRDFVYNEDNRIIESIRNVWNSSTNDWDPETVLLLEYDSEGKLAGSKRSDFDGVQSAEEHSEEASYGVNGNLGETISSNYNTETGDWEVYQKEKNYWSEHTQGTLAASNNDIDCQFANPYLLGLPWYCENLKEEVKYSVEVFDLMGRSFYKDNFSGGATFRLKNSIPPGLYIVVISGGLDIHTEKVLIRN